MWVENILGVMHLKNNGFCEQTAKDGKQTAAGVHKVGSVGGGGVHRGAGRPTHLQRLSHKPPSPPPHKIKFQRTKKEIYFGGPETEGQFELPPLRFWPLVHPPTIQCLVSAPQCLTISTDCDDIRRLKSQSPVVGVSGSADTPWVRTGVMSRGAVDLDGG